MCYLNMEFCGWKLLNFEKNSRRSKFRQFWFLALLFSLSNTSFPESFSGTWQHVFVKKGQTPFCSIVFSQNFPANIYLFKVNSKNSRKRWKISLKLTDKTPHDIIGHTYVFYCYLWISFTPFLLFLLLTLNK